MRDGTRDQLRVWVHILIVVAAVRLLELLAGCGSPPKPKAPEPRPPVVVEVTPDPLPCVLAPTPAPLPGTGSRPMPAGTWIYIAPDGTEDAPLDLPAGVFTPRPGWDALALYILGLQNVVIDAKRCHPEKPAVTP